MALPKKHKSLPPEALSPERKRLHERAPAVRVMEQFFQRLGDVLFCIKDRQRRYLWANDAFLQRVPPALRDKFIGRTAAQIFPPLLAAGYEQQDAALLAEGRETHDRLEMISQPDGSTGWFLSEKMLIRSEGGEILAIASMSRDLHLAAEDDPRIASLALALDRMRQDFAEPLRIGDLAAEAGLSLSRFERLMRAVFFVSPRQFLTRQRVEAAARLLRETGSSLASIAVGCGFCDQPTFCRQFKAVTGVTATRYRALSR